MYFRLIKKQTQIYQSIKDGGHIYILGFFRLGISSIRDNSICSVGCSQASHFQRPLYLNEGLCVACIITFYYTRLHTVLLKFL